jgi:hypothetical protein
MPFVIAFDSADTGLIPSVPDGRIPHSHHGGRVPPDTSQPLVNFGATLFTIGRSHTQQNYDGGLAAWGQSSQWLILFGLITFAVLRLPGMCHLAQKPQFTVMDK